MCVASLPRLGTVQEQPQGYPALGCALQVDFPAQEGVFVTCWSLLFSHTEADQPFLSVLDCHACYVWFCLLLVTRLQQI